MSNLLPSQRTRFIANEKFEPKWILVDAEGQTLGRLAGRLAHRLRGKHLPEYAPHQANGDCVVVINAEKIHASGKKGSQKLYHRHTGYPGGIRSTTLDRMRDTKPEEVIRLAVKRMLPAGPLGRRLLGNLKVYAGESHPHKAQNPEQWVPAFK